MKGYRRIGTWRGSALYAKDGGGVLIEGRYSLHGLSRLVFRFPLHGELSNIYNTVREGRADKLTEEEFYEYLNSEQREVLCPYPARAYGG